MTKLPSALARLTHGDAVTAFAALAQDHRLAIFRLLIRQGDAGLAAGEIASQLAITPATLSFHLNQLAHAGLIVSRRDGRSIIYTIAIASVRDLVLYLSEDCCGGHPELCQIAPIAPDTRITSRSKTSAAHKRTSPSSRVKQKGTK